ncbi:MAG TPA: glycosyltransferase family 4 protein [Pseudonocardia sp.]|nr:glycosyltransferase family 4 protein [Pseudonocardia sp.]
MTRVHVVLPGDVDDPRSPSGGNTYGRRVARELDALGWTVAKHRVAGSWPRPSAAEEAGLVRLLASVPDGETVLLDGLVACGVPEAVVPQAGRVRLVVIVHLPLAAEAGLPADVAAELDARERATLQAVDAIVVTSEAAARQLASPAFVAESGSATPRQPASPVSVTESGSATTPQPPSPAFVAEAGSTTTRQPASPVFITEPGSATPRQLDGTPPVFVAEPGTDPAPRATGTDGASALVCVAAVTPVKGHDVLVDALTSVADLPWTCVCAGPLDRAPGHVAEVRRRIERAGLTDRVRLVGPLDPAARDAAYAAADLAVAPSRTETYGMAVAEALARGLPLVATTGGALPDTVGHAPDGTRPGLLVPPDDPAALATALRRWFDEPALRAQLRAAATARAATLPTWTATAEAVAAALVPGVPAPRRAPDHPVANASAPASPTAPTSPTASGSAPASRASAASSAAASPSALAPPSAADAHDVSDARPGGEVPQPRSSSEAVRPSPVPGAAT